MYSRINITTCVIHSDWPWTIKILLTYLLTCILTYLLTYLYIRDVRNLRLRDTVQLRSTHRALKTGQPPYLSELLQRRTSLRTTRCHAIYDCLTPFKCVGTVLNKRIKATMNEHGWRWSWRITTGTAMSACRLPQSIVRFLAGKSILFLRHPPVTFDVGHTGHYGYNDAGHRVLIELLWWNNRRAVVVIAHWKRRLNLFSRNRTNENDGNCNNCRIDDRLHVGSSLAASRHRRWAWLTIRSCQRDAAPRHDACRPVRRDAAEDNAQRRVAFD